jgi:hypothetical protein
MMEYVLIVLDIYFMVLACERFIKKETWLLSYIKSLKVFKLTPSTTEAEDSNPFKKSNYKKISGAYKNKVLRPKKTTTVGRIFNNG